MSDDDLRERIAEMRHLQRQSGFTEESDPAALLTHSEKRFVWLAANLAPRLADAYDAAQATIAERDAEIAKLKAACAMAWEHLDRYGYRSHEDQIKSQDAVFEATQPYVDFTGRL